MPDIHARLRKLRAGQGLSLRAFANKLTEAGYSVSYDSVRNYEKGGTVPAEYLLAAGAVFDVRADWLLRGDLEPAKSAELQQVPRELAEVRESAGDDGPDAWQRRLRESWEVFLQDMPPQHPLREVILRSWRRSRDVGVDPRAAPEPLRRVDDATLRSELERWRSLLDVARPHMEAVSTLLGEVEHVLYIASPRGIVLHSVGNRDELKEAWGLVPGVDWSEEAMGTNGAGTALEEERAVAVIGAEHFLEPFHQAACLAVPIHRPLGELVGVLDLSTPLEAARPERLALVAYAVAVIERDLATAEDREGGAGSSG